MINDDYENCERSPLSLSRWWQVVARATWSTGGSREDQQCSSLLSQTWGISILFSVAVICSSISMLAAETIYKFCRGQILREKSTLCSHLDLWGAAMNLTTYSKENQPTKTASAISKKYSSPESCLLQSLILWLIWLFEIMMIKFDSSPAFREINQRKRLFISIFNQKHKDFLIYSSPKESFKCLKVWFLWNNSIVFLPSNCWRLGAKTRLILWRCKQFSKLK